MKIVVNRCFGGFSVSDAAMRHMGLAVSHTNWNHLSNEDFGIESEDRYAFRTDPRLVIAVKVLKGKANGAVAELEVVTIPDDVQWEIEEYDGNEWVAEKHRTW